MNSSHKVVVVVGAGAAGLGAARWLVDNISHSDAHSLEVIVVEARDRIGGRIYTYCPEESTVKGLYDLGASWIHDPSINPFTVMAKSLQLKTLDSDYGDEVVTNLGGQRYADNKFQQDFSQYELALFSSAAEARANGTSDASIETILSDKLDPSNPLFSLFMSGLEFELGAPLRHCSATECIDQDWLQAINGVGDSNSTHLDSYNQPDDFLLPESGFSAVINGLRSGAAVKKTNMEPKKQKNKGKGSAESLQASQTQSADFEVLLRHEVTHITQLETSIGDSALRKMSIAVRKHNQHAHNYVRDSAKTSSTEPDPQSPVVENSADSETVQIEADAVIVTVPLGVLKHADITFTPPLSPAKQHAINTVGFGNVVKVIAEFSSVFWPTHTLFLALADEKLANPQDRGLLTYFLNGHKMAKKKVLVGYGLGEGADRLDAMSDEEVAALVMSRCTALALPGHTVPAAPVRIIRSHWSADPYARGAYSYWAPGNLPGVRAELGRKEGQALWFAGEAVHESSILSSSAHGAWLSGVAAAAEVSAYLQLPVVLPTVIAPVARGKKTKGKTATVKTG